MFMIGIDPHKGSHTAAAVDHTEAAVACVRVDADRHQRARLLAWAAGFEPRTWAVEGATGMGALLAQQLVAAGERVVDVPPKLSSRVRLLDSGRTTDTTSVSRTRRSVRNSATSATNGASRSRSWTPTTRTASSRSGARSTPSLRTPVPPSTATCKAVTGSSIQ